MKLNNASKESPNEIAETLKNLAPNATKEEYVGLSEFIKKNGGKPMAFMQAAKNNWQTAKSNADKKTEDSIYKGDPVTYKLSYYFKMTYIPAKGIVNFERSDGKTWKNGTRTLAIKVSTEYDDSLAKFISWQLKKDSSFDSKIYKAWINKYLTGTKFAKSALDALNVKEETKDPTDIIKTIKSGNFSQDDLAYLASANGASQLGHLLADEKISQSDYDYAWKCIKRGHA